MTKRRHRWLCFPDGTEECVKCGTSVSWYPETAYTDRDGNPATIPPGRRVPPCDGGAS